MAGQSNSELVKLVVFRSGDVFVSCSISWLFLSSILSVTPLVSWLCYMLSLRGIQGSCAVLDFPVYAEIPKLIIVDLLTGVTGLKTFLLFK